MSDSPFSEEECKECDISSDHSKRTISTNSFCSGKMFSTGPRKPEFILHDDMFIFLMKYLFKLCLSKDFILCTYLYTERPKSKRHKTVFV